MYSFKLTAVIAAFFVSVFALPVPDAGASPFTLQNGMDAVALNDKFKSLSADDACTSGDDACINGKFAQCANDKFVLTPCAAGTTCAALPLVNKAGTAVTCTTAADRDARITATGATGGDAASAPAAAPASASAATVDPPVSSAASAPTSTSASDAATGGTQSFTLQNGKDAQALNAKFAGLTASSSCTSGENTCVGKDFAQCVDGEFVTTSCGATIQCVALPLVNSKGTSITCSDLPQALERIEATGAGASLTGN